MKLLTSLKDVGIGEVLGLKFKNAEKSSQKAIDKWICIAVATMHFEETSGVSARRYRTGEIYRTYKKIQLQAQTINNTNRLKDYLGIRNPVNQKFECCYDYNKKSWEIYLLENEKDKIEVIKEIMADALEVKEGMDLEIDYIPYFLSSPWLDYGE